MGPLPRLPRPPPPSMPSRVNLEFSHHLDSSILSDFLTMPTKRDSTVSVMLRSSTDVSPSLPSLETSSPVPEFTSQVTLILLEPPSTPSLTVGPPFRQSLLPDLHRLFFSSDSLSSEL